MMISTDKLANLLDIAQKAIEVDGLETTKRQRQADLSQAYKDFTERNDINERIEADSADYKQMMDETKGEYAAAMDAKRQHKNAVGRLKTAIRRYKAA